MLLPFHPSHLVLTGGIGTSHVSESGVLPSVSLLSRSGPRLCSLQRLRLTPALVRPSARNLGVISPQKPALFLTSEGHDCLLRRRS